MAWFIGQSAIMIVLAFVLGLLVGWLIWGRRLRALLVELKALRERVSECDADHLPRLKAAEAAAAAAPVEAAPAPVTAVHIPAPRAETTTVSVPPPPEANLLEAPTVEIADARSLMPEVVEDDELGADLGPGDLDGADLDGADLDGVDLDGTDLDEADDAGADREDRDSVLVAGVVGLDESVGLDGAARADEVNEAERGIHDELARVEATAAQPAIDDLARIEGIGPKFAAALVAAGIRTYDQLADASEETLVTALRAAGLTFAPSLHTWSQQARLLADGDEEGFKALTDRLVAGRVVDDADETEVDAEHVEAAPVDTEPPADFARIEGIGPKFAAALVTAGYRTFAQLADADQASLRTAIEAAGLRFAPSMPTWPEQARLLADGDEEGFAELTARLIAGRHADDALERIEGIGPQMAAALRAAGIRTFRALANADTAKLRAAIETAGLKFAPSITTWSRQARLLADGDEEGFAELTAKLIAGRDESGRS